jgi:iron(III) transport system ATP-binding protein
MIRITGLSKRFPGNATAALDDITLEISGGSFFTLFGPSGCDKSTLLRCIAGLETPDAGVIEIDGTLVFSSANGAFVPPNHRNVGMVFQSYAIWPHMTVLQNVTFPLEARHQPDAEKRARAALDMVGLGGLDQRYASRLSGGQQQRVALARTIVGNPAVLLLDEPLSNLDAALRDQMRAELQALHKSIGITTVYVSHDQTEALSMSDHIAVMREGRFVEIGSPLELYATPHSAFTARLIGGANIVAGTASPGPDGLTAIETAIGRLLSIDRAIGPVQVYMRPDKIGALRVSERPQEAVNVLDCVIAERRFAGELTEIDLVRRDGDRTTLFRCRMPTSLAMTLNEQSRLTIDPADVRILPSDDARH